MDLENMNAIDLLLLEERHAKAIEMITDDDDAGFAQWEKERDEILTEMLKRRLVPLIHTGSITI